MKTHASNHDYQIRALVLLVFVSFVILTFGIYKVVSFGNVTNDYVRINCATVSEPKVSHVLAEALYSHTYAESEFEASLPVEDWMTDPAQWVVEPSVATLAIINEEFYEEPLALESWMTNTQEWNVDMAGTDIFNDYEPELQIEGWMLSDDGWLSEEVVSAHDDTDVEASLRLEPWMLSVDEWDVPVMTDKQWYEINNAEDELLAVENWMVSCCAWVPEKVGEVEVYEFSRVQLEEALELESWMPDEESWTIEDDYRVEAYPKA